MRFENGVIAHVEGTWAHQSFMTKFEIAGKEGVIDYDSDKVAPVVTSKKETASSEGVSVPESPMKDNPYFTELQHFINCINTDAAPVVSAEDAYKAMEISFAALESIETGKAVVMKSNNERESVQ